MEDPLLLTAAITPGNVPFVAVSDGQERAIQYLCALICWIRSSGIRKIVLCENTATEVEFTDVVALARSLGKDLEIVKFSGNSEAQSLGKGYGEGRIIEHALDHSRLLRRAPRFYKATGRLFLTGFDQLASQAADRDSLFIEDYHRLDTRWKKYKARAMLRAGAVLQQAPFRQVRPGIDHLLGLPVWVNTRFFKADTAFYRQHLLKAYERVNDAQGHYLENAFADALSRFPQARAWWQTPLRWQGVSGTLGSVVYGDSDYTPAVRAEAERLFRASNPHLVPA